MEVVNIRFICYSTKDNPEEKKIVFYDHFNSASNIFIVDKFLKAMKDFVGYGEGAKLFVWSKEDSTWTREGDVLDFYERAKHRENTRAHRAALEKTFFFSREIKELIGEEQEMLLEGENLFVKVKQAYEDGEVYMYKDRKGVLIKTKFGMSTASLIFYGVLGCMIWGWLIYVFYRSFRRFWKRRRARLATIKEAQGIYDVEKKKTTKKTSNKKRPFRGPAERKLKV